MLKINNIEFEGSIIFDEEGAILITPNAEIELSLIEGNQYDIENGDSAIYLYRNYTGMVNSQYKFELPEDMKPQLSETEKLQQQVASLQEENSTLLECVLEMSEIVYA